MIIKSRKRSSVVSGFFVLFFGILFRLILTNSSELLGDITIGSPENARDVRWPYAEI